MIEEQMPARLQIPKTLRWKLILLTRKVIQIMLKKQDLEFNQRFMTVLFKPTVSRFTVLFKFKIFNQNYNKIL